MRLECTVIEKIVQTAFPDEIIDAYNIEYLDTMTKFIREGVDANTFTKENGQKQFKASESQEIRLTLFKSFLEKQAALFNMSAPVTATHKDKKEKNTGNPSVHLVNECEKYICQLCNTAHKDKN